MINCRFSNNIKPKQYILQKIPNLACRHNPFLACIMVSIYPKSFEQYQTILCTNQLLRQLQTHEAGLLNPFYTKYRVVGSKNMEFACRMANCTAFMQYQLTDEQVYRFVQGINVHNHILTEKLMHSNNSSYGQLNKRSSIPIIYGFNKLFINKEMFQAYKLYYRCMYIVVTKAKNYTLLSFSCSLPCKDIAIFGLVIYEKPLKGLIRDSLKEFVSRKKEIPETIICNHAQLANLAAEYFPKTNFILTNQEISPNYKVRYGFNRLIELVTCETDWEKEHRKLVTYIRECISPAQIKEIFEDYKRMCFPFLPRTFVGLGVQLFHSLVLEQTSQQNIFFTNDVHKFLTNFPSQIKTCFQDLQMKDFVEQVGITSNNLLIDVYAELDEPVVKFLVSQQNRTFFCDMFSLPYGAFEVRYKFNKRCKVEKINQKWECDCGIQVKTGLPCCHVMKILLVLRLGIRDYIDQYWLPEKKSKKQIIELA